MTITGTIKAQLGFRIFIKHYSGGLVPYVKCPWRPRGAAGGVKVYRTEERAWAAAGYKVKTLKELEAVPQWLVCLPICIEGYHIGEPPPSNFCDSTGPLPVATGR
jgi:hypothetical protein